VADTIIIDKDMKIDLLTDRQKILETRKSGRIQDQVLKKHKIPSPKKKIVESNSIPDQNSFAVLGNAELVGLAAGMVVQISDLQFNKIDLMRDIEIARKALHLSKQKDIVDPNLGNDDEMIPKISDSLLLGWTCDDSDSEHFTLVQSKKKKKKIGFAGNFSKEE
jgi:hypothetical protein